MDTVFFFPSSWLAKYNLLIHDFVLWLIIIIFLSILPLKIISVDMILISIQFTQWRIEKSTTGPIDFLIFPKSLLYNLIHPTLWSSKSCSKYKIFRKKEYLWSKTKYDPTSQKNDRITKWKEKKYIPEDFKNYVHLFVCSLSWIFDCSTQPIPFDSLTAVTLMEKSLILDRVKKNLHINTPTTKTDISKSHEFLAQN